MRDSEARAREKVADLQGRNTSLGSELDLTRKDLKYSNDERERLQLLADRPQTQEREVDIMSGASNVSERVKSATLKVTNEMKTAHDADLAAMQSELDLANRNNEELQDQINGQDEEVPEPPDEVDEFAEQLRAAAGLGWGASVSATAAPAKGEAEAPGETRGRGEASRFACLS